VGCPVGCPSTGTTLGSRPRLEGTYTSVAAPSTAFQFPSGWAVEQEGPSMQNRVINSEPTARQLLDGYHTNQHRLHAAVVGLSSHWSLSTSSQPLVRSCCGESNRRAMPAHQLPGCQTCSSKPHDARFILLMLEATSSAVVAFPHSSPAHGNAGACSSVLPQTPQHCGRSGCNSQSMTCHQLVS
jgi:hypothetical protein